MLKAARITLIGTIASAIIGLIGVIIGTHVTAAEQEKIFEAETLVAQATNLASTPQPTQTPVYKYPIPKINPLPNDLYGKIAFLRSNGNHQDFIIANSDGSDEYLVTKTSWSIYCPRIAPGGEKVVFVSAYEGRESVYVINRDGSGLTRLSEPSDAKHDGCASWSLDGSSFVYTREYSGFRNDIYVMDRYGNNQKSLTNVLTRQEYSEHEFSEFPWSPDSQRIVFDEYSLQGILPGPSDGLFIVNKNDGNITRITPSTGLPYYDAVWAPNRNEIAYVSTEGPNSDAEIFTLDLDNPKAKPIDITHDPHYNTNPAWSPDGTQILFVSYRDGNADLYEMNSDGSNVRRITDTPEAEDSPSWLR